MGLLIERFCSHFPFLSSLFPVSHFPFPVPVPVLIFLSSFQLKKIIRSYGYCFFQRQMKLIYVNRNLGFSMRGDVFVFLCDCRQTRCRWGEIKDKGASFIFKLNYFLSKGPGDLRVTSFSMESFTNTSLDRQTKGKNFQSKGHFQ